MAGRRRAETPGTQPLRGDTETDAPTGPNAVTWSDEDAVTLPQARARPRPRHDPDPTTRGPKIRPRGILDDNRPTEIFEPAAKRSLHASREQLIRGSTISEMMRNPGHSLARPLSTLFARAKADLPTAVVDERAVLHLHHDFEFDQRVGYRLRLELFDPENQQVEVSAEVDADGKAIRRGSMMSRLISI